MIELTNTQAIDILNRFDRADGHGKLMPVCGGLTGLLSASTFLAQLQKAEDGEESVEVCEHLYAKYMNGLHNFEVQKYGITKETTEG